MYSTFNTFEYNGAEFQRVHFGELLFYKVSFPLVSKTTGQHVADYNLFLRNDPRTLRSIPIKGSLNIQQHVLITSDENLVCADNNIALANLVQFVQNIASSDVQARANVTCKNNPAQTTLISIQNSSESWIEESGQDCYVLHLKECAVLNVTERFIVGTIAQSRGYSI